MPKMTDKDSSLPIMYWLPKLHKTPIGDHSLLCPNIVVLNHYQV